MAIVGLSTQKQDPLPSGEASRACPLKKSILSPLCSCCSFSCCNLPGPLPGIIALPISYRYHGSFRAETTRSRYIYGMEILAHQSVGTLDTFCLEWTGCVSAQSFNYSFDCLSHLLAWLGNILMVLRRGEKSSGSPYKPESGIFSFLFSLFSWVWFACFVICLWITTQMYTFIKRTFCLGIRDNFIGNNYRQTYCRIAEAKQCRKITTSMRSTLLH